MSATTVASAQSPKAAAEGLYNEGRKLMTEGRFAEACPKFEASQRLDPGSGTQLNLAHCLEKLGKTASAWAEYKDAAAAAHAAVEASREVLAQKGAAELEGSLSKLRISAEPTPGLEVRLDGVVLSAGTLNSDLPTDPGDHVLEANAAGRQGFKTTVTLGANGDKKAVTIPALAIDPAAAPPATSGQAPHSIPEVAKETPPSSHWGAQRTAGVVIGAAGLAGVVVGAIFGANALSKESSSKAHCLPGDPTQCDSQGGSSIADARSAATVSTIAFIAGGVAVAGGVVLVLTGGPNANKEHASVAADLRPIAGVGTGGLALHCSW